jgi:hypothetical protein
MFRTHIAAVALAGLALASVHAQNAAPAPRIKTAFAVVSLWSPKMMDVLDGTRQFPCSGPNSGNCERLNTGVCDGTAYFAVAPLSDVPEAPERASSKLLNSEKPQSFHLVIREPSYGFEGNRHWVPLEKLGELELIFGCSFDDNDACPGGRLQTGEVHRVEVGSLGGGKIVDLTHAARVLPDGPVAVPIDPALKTSLFADRRALYQVHAVAECFAVVPRPITWTLPLYDSPSSGGNSLGALVAHVTPLRDIQFAYRTGDGSEYSVRPDWLEPDRGYTFLMEQTILDRQGDWYLLPRRPFPRPVWVHLPDRQEPSVISSKTIYKLKETVRARRSGGSRIVTLEPDTYFVVTVRNRYIEMRKDVPGDMPCGGDEPAPKRPLRTYIVDRNDLYDTDLHLLLEPAYTRGC